MPTTIESLELEINQNTGSSVSGIDALSNSLSRLKNAVKGGVGLTRVATQMRDFNSAVSGMDASAPTNISRLADALERLKNLGSFKLSSSISNQIKSIGSAASALSTVDFSGVSNLATALAPLNGIVASTGLQSVITQLRQIPALANTLNGVNWSQFTYQIQNLADSLVPLVNRLNSLSVAFGTLPADIRNLVRSTDNLVRMNERARMSYMNLWAALRIARNLMRSTARMIASWINESNKYVEDLNLFNVAMGEYAVEAKKYAEQVSELLGIDPADWMRNQGVFDTIIRGFGVASDKAYLMSKNLTQLGYDISSFYNISVDESMKKLASGIAGELEPLRRIGYDLSVARLQQEAYNLGVKKSITQMTQAEKSQLRYYAILTQVKDAQGDMARTLNAPANQLRVLRAQLTMAARAIGNIFIPALNAVLPYVIVLTKAIRALADSIANLVGFKLPEVDYSGITQPIGDVTDQTEELGDTAEKATKKVKKLKKSIMSFDELNILNGKNDDNALSNLADSLNGLGSEFNIPLPEYDFLGGLVQKQVGDIMAIIKSAMWEILSVLAFFSVVIGTILVVTGLNIPVGLALMAAGAGLLATAVVANWGTMSTKLAAILSTLMGVLGGFLFAIGAFLTFTGVNIPLGVALMVAGATVAATAIVMDWKFLNGNMKSTLGILMEIVGGAFLALGAFFLVTGISPTLGAGLIIAGIGTAGVGAGLRWDAMSEPLRTALSTLGAIVGAALFTLGVILAISGVSLPIGLALIAAGVANVAGSVFLNWGALTGELSSRLEALKRIVGGSLLGIGVVLAWSGVNIPLGLAMIVAGAGSIISSLPLDWGMIIGKIGSVFKDIVGLVGVFSFAIGVVLAFSGVALPIGIALMAAGVVGMVTGIALNWDLVFNTVKNVLKRIGIILGSALLAIGVILTMAGILPLGIGLIAAGAVGLVTGIALNFKAVVSTVKGFFDNIKKMFVGAALVGLGLLLLGTGAGAPLGFGLITMGASAVAKPQNFDLNKLVNIGKNAIGGLKKGVSDAWKNFLTYWKGIFQGALNWLLGFFGIHSPSTVMANIGMMMVAGLSNGLKNIGSVFTNAFQIISKWLGGFGKNMYNWGSEMMGNLVSGINSGLKSLASKVSEAAEKIRSYLHFSQPDIGPLADFNTWMPDMMNQLASGIADHEDVVKKQVAKLAEDMSLESSIQANVSAYGARATVSNGGDIETSGLGSAIYNAVTSALSAQSEANNDGTPIIINIGNEQFASFMVKQNKRVALISGGRA